MSRQIIKQPNGKYCIFSSIVDNIVWYNMSKEDIIEEWTQEFKKDISKKVYEIVDQLEDGKRPYYQFTQTFDEILSLIGEIHGEKEVLTIKNLLNK